jgi:putative membrane protein
MKFIRRLLLTSIAVFGLAYFLPGISVVNFKDALLVALVLGFVRAIVQPILVFLTLPITILTLGLFLLVINACMVLLVDALLVGFSVANFGYALLFSLMLSILQSMLYSFFDAKKAKK